MFRLLVLFANVYVKHYDHDNYDFLERKIKETMLKISLSNALYLPVIKYDGREKHNKTLIVFYMFVREMLSKYIILNTKFLRNGGNDIKLDDIVTCFSIIAKMSLVCVDRDILIDNSTSQLTKQIKSIAMQSQNISKVLARNLFKQPCNWKYVIEYFFPIDKDGANTGKPNGYTILPLEYKTNTNTNSLLPKIGQLHPGRANDEMDNPIKEEELFRTPLYHIIAKTILGITNEYFSLRSISNIPLGRMARPSSATSFTSNSLEDLTSGRWSAPVSQDPTHKRAETRDQTKELENFIVHGKEKNYSYED